jgi:hypothetical protein
VSRGRRIAVVALLVFGTLFWTCFGLGLWAKRQVLDTNNWVDTSTQLLENDEIRTALALYLVDTLYASADVQQRLQAALPDRLDGLAAPAAAALKEAARRNAPRVLGSAAALNAWRTANRTAHETLINIVEHDGKGGVSLDLGTMVQQLADKTGLPGGVADKVPPGVATLQVARPEQLDNAKKALDLFQTAVWVLLVLALLCYAGAIWLSGTRRRTILTIGGTMIFAALLIAAVRRLGGRAIVDQYGDAPNAHAAVQQAWDIATSLLVNVAAGSLLLGFFVVTGAWLAGPGRATAVRSWMAPAFRDHAGLVRAGLAVAILLLIMWGPVPWTQNPLTVLIFAIAAYLWLEWIRVRTLDEFPAALPPPAEPPPAPA